MANVLVVGSDSKQVGWFLEHELPEGTRVDAVESSASSEGFGVDVVVVTGSHPLEALAEVRVHPQVSEAPIVLLAPGYPLDDRGWRGIWPVTGTGPGILDDVAERVGRLLARARHPSTQSADPTFAPSIAS